MGIDDQGRIELSKQRADEIVAFVAERRRKRRREIAERVFVAAAQAEVPEAFGVNRNLPGVKSAVARLLQSSFDLADAFLDFEPEPEPEKEKHVDL